MALEITKANRVALIRIRHNAANTLTADSFDEIQNIFTSLEVDDTVRVVVITGNDTGYFSNGFEPALFLDKSYEYNHSVCKLVNLTASNYFYFKKPIIACLNGHAMGAGAVFALFSDWRFMASDGARFGFPEALLGMNFPAYTAHYMKDLVGFTATRDILFAGKSIKAPEALEIHLIDRIYPNEELLTETVKFAEKLAKSPLQVLVGMKRAMKEPYRILFDQLRDADAAELARYMTSPTTQEGLRSIVEKRRPRFD